MLRTAILAAAVVCTALPVLAQEARDFSGTYLGAGEGDLTVELNHIEKDRYGIAIDTVVPMENDIPGCAGGVKGEVLLSEKGGNLLVENEMYDPESDSPMFSHQYCEVNLTFDADGFLIIQERDGCLEYHGASCGFSGKLVSSNAAG